MPKFTKDTPTALQNLTDQERRALSSKAGKQSVAVRKRNKTLREHFEAFGTAKPNPVVKEQFAKLGIPVDEDDTMLDCMFKWAGIKSVAQGTKMVDLLKFFEVFGKYTGQEPAQKHELTGADGTPLNSGLSINLDLVKEMEAHLDKTTGTDN